MKKARQRRRPHSQERDKTQTKLLALLDDKGSKRSAEVWTRLLRLLDDNGARALLAALEAELDGGSPVSLKVSMVAADAVRKMMSTSTTKERRILGFKILGQQKEAKADQEIHHIRDVVLGRVQAQGINDRMIRLQTRLTSKQVQKLTAGLAKLRELVRRAGRVFGLGGVRPR